MSTTAKLHAAEPNSLKKSSGNMKAMYEVNGKQIMSDKETTPPPEI